jgi:hypothetical protein
MARRDEEFTISFKGAYVEKDMALTCGRGYVAHPLSSRQWEEIKLEQAFYRCRGKSAACHAVLSQSRVYTQSFVSGSG